MVRLLGLFLFSLIPFFVFSQTKNDRFDFGVKLGFNYGSVAARDVHDDSKSGFEGTQYYVSIFTEFHLDNFWSIQSELGISEVDIYSFIEFPVIVKYELMDCLQIGLGPKLYYIPTKDYKDFMDVYFKNRIGFGLEGLFQYNFGKHFFIESTYTYGFTNQVYDDLLMFKDGRWRAFRLGVGYKF